MGYTLGLLVRPLVHLRVYRPGLHGFHDFGAGFSVVASPGLIKLDPAVAGSWKGLVLLPLGNTKKAVQWTALFIISSD